MKLIILLFVFLAIPVHAQDVTDVPIHFIIKNEAPYRVYGEISTDYIKDEKGRNIRHTGSFRLEKKGTRHEDGHYLDRSEFSSNGPFYPGKQLELTIRTLIPIFSCKTNVEIGEIIIRGKILEDGTTKTWAVCY